MLPRGRSLQFMIALLKKQERDLRAKSSQKKATALSALILGSGKILSNGKLNHSVCQTPTLQHFPHILYFGEAYQYKQECMWELLLRHWQAFSALWFSIPYCFYSMF